MAGNPLPEEAEFVVSAERAHEGHLETLATQVQKIPVFAEGRFSVAELDGDDHDVLRLRIRPGEAQPLEFRAVLAGELGAEEFAAFQVVQRIEGREAPIGGVGVLVHRG
jgi:hypothetical protein